MILSKQLNTCEVGKVMNKLIINGLFYTQRTTGVQRFAKELIRELDNVIEKNKISIIVPDYAENMPQYKNIEIIHYGKMKGMLWEQINLFYYLKKHNMISLSLCNSQPVFCPGIMCIHDAAYKTHPEYFKTIHGKLSVYWHRLNFWIAKIQKHPIITVSYFSKYQLIDTYKIKPERLLVIGNGWQHMNRIDEDDTILEKNNLKRGEFFFTLGNINYNKNTKWVLDFAEKNPEYIFVLSGIKVKNSSIDIPHTDNVKWLGYLSDGEIKSLYKHCRAFIFPSIHEGFGIPPMEALSQGAEIIIANTTCLPEIYGNSAHYIDPYDINVDVEKLLKKDVGSKKLVLNKYSWKKSAEILKELIYKYN